MRLAGKVSAITGAGSGIGRATALLFARQGSRVVVADLDAPGAQGTVEAIREAGGDALAVEADVSRAEDVDRLLAATLGGYGRLDVLVNNAGFGVAATVEDTDEATWDRLMAVNVKGVFLCCRSVVPVMRRQGGGVIVNTASSTALVGIARRAAYCASKGAVAALTRAMAIDHAGEGIRVNCVAPGTIDTPYFDEMTASVADPGAFRADLAERQVMGRLGTPEEVASAILYLAGDESSFCTGSMLVVDGGMTAR